MNRRRTATAAIASILVLIASAGCDDLDGRTKVRQANRKFRETRFIDAATLYEQALTKVQDDKIEYNLGLTYSRIFRAGSTELVLLGEGGQDACSAIPENKVVKRSVCVKNDPAEEDRAYPHCGATKKECTDAWGAVAKMRDKQLKDLEAQATNKKHWDDMTNELSEQYLDRSKFLAEHEKAEIDSAIIELEKASKAKGCDAEALKKQIAELKARLETDKAKNAEEKKKAKEAAEKKVAETKKAEQDVIAAIKKGGDGPTWLASQKAPLDACPTTGQAAMISCLNGLTEWNEGSYTSCLGSEDCPSSATCKREIDMCAIDNTTLANLSAKHLALWIEKEPPDEEIKASVKTQQAEIEKRTKERDQAEADAEAAKDPATGKFKDKAAYEKAMQRKTSIEELLKTLGNELEDTRLKFMMRALMTNLWIDSNQYDKAIAYWEGELKKRPSDFEAMGNLAGISLKSNNWRKAIEWYLTIAEKVPEESNKVVAYSSVGNIAWSKLNAKNMVPEEAVALADLGIGALEKATDLAPKNLAFYRLQVALYNFRALAHGSSYAAFIDRANSQDLKALSDVVKGKPAEQKKMTLATRNGSMQQPANAPFEVVASMPDTPDGSCNDCAFEWSPAPTAPSDKRTASYTFAAPGPQTIKVNVKRGGKSAGEATLDVEIVDPCKPTVPKHFDSEKTKEEKAEEAKAEQKKAGG